MYIAGQICQKNLISHRQYDVLFLLLLAAILDILITMVVQNIFRRQISYYIIYKIM